MAQEAIEREHDEDDEFSAAEAAQAIASGYAATAERDAEDQREYRLIPRGTACELGVAGFGYVPAQGAKKAALTCKVEVNAPSEFADGSSNFTARLSLNPVVGKNEDGSDKQRSGWDMTVDILSWLYASANQCTAQEGKAAMVNEVLAEFPDLDPDDVPAFHAALAANANENLKGKTVRVKSIGVQVGQSIASKPGQKYNDKQDFGTLDYPKATKGTKN